MKIPFWIFTVLILCAATSTAQDGGFQLRSRTTKPRPGNPSRQPANTTSPTKQTRPAETLFLTLRVISDLEGTLWVDSKSYPLTAAGEAVNVPIFRSNVSLFFEGPDGFNQNIKEEFIPSQRGSTLEKRLQMQQAYKLYLHRQASKSRSEEILDGIFRQMIFLTGDEDSGQMEPFEISRYEVTVRQFAEFVAQTEKPGEGSGSADSSYILLRSNRRVFRRAVTWRHDPFGNLRPESDYDHPVVNVSWQEAMAFCDWLSKQDVNYDYRLPKDFEWEYAAGCGSYRFQYPWGDDLEVDNILPANTADISLQQALPQRKSSVSGLSDSYPFTSPVGSFTPNCYGLFDMGGNVAEWVLEDFQTERLGRIYSEKLIKGGSFLDTPERCKVLDKKGMPPERKDATIGFRVVRVAKMK